MNVVELTQCALKVQYYNGCKPLQWGAQLTIKILMFKLKL